MFRFWRAQEPEGEVAHYEGSFLVAQYDEHVGAVIKREIAEKLTDAWIEQYGSQLLDKVAPEEVEKAIKQAVAERLLKQD